MSKRIAALMVITMLLLSVTGCASSYGEASKTENTTEVQSSPAETTAQVTTAAQTTTAEQVTTEEQTTAEETQTSTENADDAQMKQDYDFTLLTDSEYYDPDIGATFSIPESWKGNVFAVKPKSSDRLELAFVEKTNYESHPMDLFGWLGSICIMESGTPISVELGSVTVDGERLKVYFSKPSDTHYCYYDEELSNNYNELYQAGYGAGVVVETAVFDENRQFAKTESQE